MPADLLAYGSKSRTKLGQELLARLKRGEAEVAVVASDVANDDDVEGEYRILNFWSADTNNKGTTTGSEGTPSDDE